MSSDSGQEEYKVVLHEFTTFDTKALSNARVMRVGSADIGPWSSGDWLLMDGEDIVTHFKDQDHIDSGYVKNWFKGYIDGLTK